MESPLLNIPPENTEQLPESIPCETVTHNLINLGLEEKKDLSTRIEKWNGIVRIFVHPMYKRWRGYSSENSGDGSLE